jgi:predicted transposase YbfD/YdcC
MPVSHARVTAVTSTDDELPGLLEVLARVPDPRTRRGRRYTLVFMLAVAVACVLAGAKNFREIGDQAGDLPQEVLARLGGRPHPLLRTITAPSEKRIRTLLQEIDAARLDELTGGWLRGLADAGRLDNLLRAIAIDGKWLRGIGDRQQVKLFAAMLHEQKVIVAQHAIPEDTNEITEVRQLLDPVDLAGAVVTGDAAHAQRQTAAYIAGAAGEGGRESDYFLFVKANQPGLQRAVYGAIQAGCPREPDHVEIDYSHGRIIKRSLWATDAAGLDFPHRPGHPDPPRWLRRRWHRGLQGDRARCHQPARRPRRSRMLAKIARGQWGIESVHWVRDTAYREDSSTGYRGSGPQVMATCRNIAISLLYLAGVTAINRTLQAIGRDRTRMLSYLPL